MIIEKKKVVLKGIESVHLNDSYKYAKIDNIPVSCFHPEKHNIGQSSGFLQVEKRSLRH